MTKTYQVKNYYRLIGKNERRAYRMYEHKRNTKYEHGDPRQMHYFSYLQEKLTNFDNTDLITVSSDGKYSIRRNNAEVGYGDLNLDLLNNPCYPKYAAIK